MTDAIRAAYSSFKHVPTRSVLQLVLEVPIEQAEDALALLGIPQPGTQTWCAIARLNDSAVEPSSALPLPADTVGPETSGGGATGRPAPHPLVQMAGILCNDAQFQNWFRNYAGADFAGMDTAEALRKWLGIESRRKLATDETAAHVFKATVALFKSETGQMAEKRG